MVLIVWDKRVSTLPKEIQMDTQKVLPYVRSDLLQKPNASVGQ